MTGGQEAKIPKPQILKNTTKIPPSPNPKKTKEPSPYRKPTNKQKTTTKHYNIEYGRSYIKYLEQSSSSRLTNFVFSMLLPSSPMQVCTGELEHNSSCTEISEALHLLICTGWSWAQIGTHFIKILIAFFFFFSWFLSIFKLFHSIHSLVKTGSMVAILQLLQMYILTCIFNTGIMWEELSKGERVVLWVGSFVLGWFI